jgi:hypothetical protein
MLRHGPASLPPTRRLRVSVHLAALLLLFISFAQAVHHHVSWNVVAQTHAVGKAPNLIANELDLSELTCPLCIASHTVLPSFPVRIARLQFCAEIVSFVFHASEPRGFWSYKLFSRPPPQI